MLRKKIQAHCKVIKSLEINKTKIKSISKKITDDAIIVKSNNTALIQESHIFRSLYFGNC
jgi:phosphoheptose isomerase